MLPLYPQWNYETIPTNFCGAGKGFWEWVVPDVAVIAGQRNIKISVACGIHDMDFDFAPPTWDAFHEANSRLYANVKSVILAKATTENGRLAARRFPAIYAHAVDTAGRKVFWSLKKEQGYDIPLSAAWLI